MCCSAPSESDGCVEREREREWQTRGVHVFSLVLWWALWTFTGITNGCDLHLRCSTCWDISLFFVELIVLHCVLTITSEKLCSLLYSYAGILPRFICKKVAYKCRVGVFIEPAGFSAVNRYLLLSRKTFFWCKEERKWCLTCTQLDSVVQS